MVSMQRFIYCAHEPKIWLWLSLTTLLLVGLIELAFFSRTFIWICTQAVLLATRNPEHFQLVSYANIETT